MNAGEKFGFGEKGERVPFVDFEFPTEGNESDLDNDPENTRKSIREALVLLLEKICEGDAGDDASDKEAGRNAKMYRHLLRRGQTHAELAEQLDVSRQRASQLLANFKSKKANVFNVN